ncbi:unnamed protein product [marine sediment metagenome]|uniref:Helix-turn-helix domain-containing protein n=1 Tax=marine sediment metagenome TaxID=412755 RepID=X0UBQ5_9ZZZZ
MITGSHDPRLIPVREAARLRGIYARRLWAAIQDGALPAYKIGGWLRVRLADVDDWIESTRFQPLPRADERGTPR